MINHEAPHVLYVCVCVCVWGIDIVYKKTWHSCQITREKKKKKKTVHSFGRCHYLLRNRVSTIYKQLYLKRQILFVMFAGYYYMPIDFSFLFFSFLSKIDVFHLGFAASSGKSWVYCFVI